MKIKLLIFSMFITLNVIACWYQKSNYTDYIYSINDNVIHTEENVSGISKYTVTNNIVVDLPITVSVKLISDQVIDLNDMNQTSEAGEILRCSLQYRVLPDGNWVTACNYNTPLGTIPTNSVPKTYFGLNNIYPQNLKAGDVIMIRLYATDGMWQSGEMDNMVTNRIQTITTSYGNKKTLPYNFQYLMDGSSVRNYNLGGFWYPHLVTTVIYSGNERPIR